MTSRIQAIRYFIEQGMTDEEIEDAMIQIENEEEEDIRRYGPEDDMRSPSEAQYQDRLDMGRNDAGEWLGFM